VEKQAQDAGSMLSLQRALLELRRKRPALAFGSYEGIAAGAEIVGYLRAHGASRDAVLLNLSSRPQRVNVSPTLRRAKIELSTHTERRGQALGATLLANEGVVLQVAK
jgi:alpha-glucosidase